MALIYILAVRVTELVADHFHLIWSHSFASHLIYIYIVINWYGLLIIRLIADDSNHAHFLTSSVNGFGHDADSKMRFQATNITEW